MKNKKMLIIVSSIVAIILIIIIVLLLIKLKHIKDENGEENIQIYENEIGNMVEEDQEDKDEEENDLVDSNTEIETGDNQEQTTNDNPIKNTPVADPKQEVDKQTIKKQQSDEEKAKNIARKDWGEDNSVYVSHDDIRDGKHIVTIRDQGTHILKTYIINVDNGTFETQDY